MFLLWMELWITKNLQNYAKKVIKYANDHLDKIDGPYVSVTWSYVTQNI